MILNKLTKKWLAGERLTGNYWLSTGTYRGCPVIFITWPQDNNKSEVITYITKNDLVDGDPLIELFDLGVTPDWLNQDQFEIGLGCILSYMHKRQADASSDRIRWLPFPRQAS